MQARPSDLDHLRWLNNLGLSSFVGQRILDLGCGSGFVCHQASTQGAIQAIGLDMVRPKGISPNSPSPWTFIEANLDDPVWQNRLAQDQKFDWIMAFDILEHLKSPYCFLRSCQSILAKGGRLVVTTPNTQSWERYLKPSHWSGVIDPQHKILFDHYSLNFLLQKTGFSSIQIQAPIRRLSFLNRVLPAIGGQLICLASKVEPS